MIGNKILVGSRRSPLAIWQAERIISLIVDGSAQKGMGWEFAIDDMSTYGDLHTEAPVSGLGTTGVFTGELDRALLEGRIDIAVHSLKDVATALPPGIEISAVAERADFRDALVSDDYESLDDLPPGARLGTGSLRRAAQLKLYRRDLSFVPIRGNVDTRLKKMKELGLDGLILAAAGLDRLGFGNLIRQRIPPEICLPAPGQGAICAATKENGPKAGLLQEILKPAVHVATSLETAAERSFMAAVGGGCSSPIGALGRFDMAEGTVTLFGIIVEADGSGAAKGSITGDAGDIQRMAGDLAAKLLKDGR